MAVKFRNTASRFYLRAVYSQSALWMAYDQLLCNELIRNHSRETNTTYAYKIRLRTDYAPVAPFPPLHTVDFGTDKAPKVRISTATALQRRQRGWLCGWQDEADGCLFGSLSTSPRMERALHLDHRGIPSGTIEECLERDPQLRQRFRASRHARKKSYPRTACQLQFPSVEAQPANRARLTDWETQGLPEERDRPHPQQ